MTLNPIKYKRGNLEILNQLEIPEKLEFIPIPDVKEAWEGVMKGVLSERKLNFAYFMR